MTQFQNPHIGINGMQQQPMQQQPMQPGMVQQYTQQQPMQPGMMQQQPMQQYPMQPGMQPGMIQQHMQQPMQQYIQQQPMQPGMMQQGMVNQPMQRPMQQQSQNFLSLQNNQNQFPNNQANSDLNVNSRFNSGSVTFEEQEINTQQDNITFKTEPYEIYPFKDYSIYENDNVKVTTDIKEITEKDIKVTDSLVMVDCFQEAVEDIIEKGILEDKILSSSYIITTNFYKGYKQSDINDLLKEDSKDLSIKLKQKLSQKLNKHELYTLMYLNNYLTDKVNEFLNLISIEDSITIDRFDKDYIELIDLFNSNKEFSYIHNLILSYMTYIIHELLSSTNKVLDISEAESDDNEKPITVMANSCELVYVDKLSEELGLVNVPENYTELKESILNGFLKSIYNEFSIAKNNDTIYLVTLDRKVICLKSIEPGKLYIKIC